MNALRDPHPALKNQLAVATLFALLAILVFIGLLNSPAVQMHSVSPIQASPLSPADKEHIMRNLSDAGPTSDTPALSDSQKQVIVGSLAAALAPADMANVPQTRGTAVFGSADSSDPYAAFKLMILRALNLH